MDSLEELIKRKTRINGYIYNDLSIKEYITNQVRRIKHWEDPVEFLPKRNKLNGKDV